jgi:glycosyltransferase involved in cell wall biosynthesis
MPDISDPDRQPLLLVYWGRNGINQLVAEAFDALSASARRPVVLCLSRQNVDWQRFAGLGDRLVTVNTFTSNLGASAFWRILRLRRAMTETVRSHGITDVVTLMPHVWSSAVSSAFVVGGAHYHTIIHDAKPHPGDGSGLALPLLLRDTRGADSVFALSEGVAADVLALGLVEQARLKVLFHPVIGRFPGAVLNAPKADEPWRLLFLGRIRAYKGLPLLTATISRLKDEGRRVHLSVMGQGSLGESDAPLRALGAEVVNRWLDESDITAALATHHAVILSHIEASQSGIAASALGAGVPIVATPVGGLIEQVHDGETGLLAESTEVEALAAAIRRLMDTPNLHDRLVKGSAATRTSLSPSKFANALLDALVESRAQAKSRNIST